MAPEAKPTINAAYELRCGYIRPVITTTRPSGARSFVPVRITFIFHRAAFPAPSERGHEVGFVQVVSNPRTSSSCWPCASRGIAIFAHRVVARQRRYGSRATSDSGDNGPRGRQRRPPCRSDFDSERTRRRFGKLASAFLFVKVWHFIRTPPETLPDRVPEKSVKMPIWAKVVSHVDAGDTCPESVPLPGQQPLCLLVNFACFDEFSALTATMRFAGFRSSLETRFISGIVINIYATVAGIVRHHSSLHGCRSFAKARVRSIEARLTEAASTLWHLIWCGLTRSPRALISSLCNLRRGTALARNSFAACMHSSRSDVRITLPS